MSALCRCIPKHAGVDCRILLQHPIDSAEGVWCCLQDATTCKNHPYLHASMWMAPLPHEDSHVIKGKTGAPLSGCHLDVHSHPSACQPLLPSFGSWTQIAVPMHM